MNASTRWDSNSLSIIWDWDCIANVKTGHVYRHFCCSLVHNMTPWEEAHTASLGFRGLIVNWRMCLDWGEWTRRRKWNGWFDLDPIPSLPFSSIQTYPRPLFLGFQVGFLQNMAFLLVKQTSSLVYIQLSKQSYVVSLVNFFFLSNSSCPAQYFLWMARISLTVTNHDVSKLFNMVPKRLELF